MSLEVVRPGPLTLIQDAGRPGYAAVGVGPSGAFDRAALALSLIHIFSRFAQVPAFGRDAVGVPAAPVFLGAQVCLGGVQHLSLIHI